MFLPLARMFLDAGTASQPWAAARRGAPSASRQTPASTADQLLGYRQRPWLPVRRILLCELLGMLCAGDSLAKPLRSEGCVQSCWESAAAGLPLDGLSRSPRGRAMVAGPTGLHGVRES